MSRLRLFQNWFIYLDFIIICSKLDFLRLGVPCSELFFWNLDVPFETFSELIYLDFIIICSELNFLRLGVPFSELIYLDFIIICSEFNFLRLGVPCSELIGPGCFETSVFSCLRLVWTTLLRIELDSICVSLNSN